MSKVDWFSQDLAAEADECGEDDAKRVRLMAAVSAATTWIASNASLGSPEIGIQLKIPGLRNVRVQPNGEFDYLAFYVIEKSGVVRMSRLVWPESDFAWKLRVAQGKANTP